MEISQDKLELRFLDHVGIVVSDLDRSAAWYQDVLGLKKYELPKWGKCPVFLLAGKTGVALFPMKTTGDKNLTESPAVYIDHFAFNVDQLNFEKAIQRYNMLNLDYTIKNHHYFKSVYTKDPDGHVVELTTILVDEHSFYASE